MIVEQLAKEIFEIDLQSFCQSNKQDTESSKREYEVTFHALYLDFRPSGGDTIEWDGIIYMISGDEDIHKVLEGCYDITGRQKKHTTGRRR